MFASWDPPRQNKAYATCLQSYNKHLSRSCEGVEGESYDCFSLNQNIGWECDVGGGPADCLALASSPTLRITKTIRVAFARNSPISSNH